ncbi:MAG: SIS domain-containing protein [Syntrophaceae bacterium]|nr:SIS domain-containing protein [Syntrophaceae bacterium]
MIYIKKLNILKKFLFFLVNCRISIGANPDTVNAPSIIFIPLLPNQLNCGFAGLMTCRLQKKHSNITADERLIDIWEKNKNARLQTVLSGENTAKNHLNGIDTIQKMSIAIAELKQEEAQEHIFFQKSKSANLSRIIEGMKIFLTEEEKLLEDKAPFISSVDMESINSILLSLKDICWILEKDIFANLEKILQLSGHTIFSEVNSATFRKFRKLNLLLNALDRLEVRGRDSAGIQLSFFLKNEKSMQNIMQQITKNGLSDAYQQRTQKGDLLNQSIFISRGQKNDYGNINVTFTYKTFSVVGELGRNVTELRNVIQSDNILQVFAAMESVCETALTHTRWASVGAITEENCHPVNNYTIMPSTPFYPLYPGMEAQINVVLNGDIDNYMALRQFLETPDELIAAEVTTDTKIIPLQIEKYLKEGKNLTEAFRFALNDFEGSHAIAMTSNLEPGKTFLALKGSGQAIYIGMNADQYMFSSELYGLVEVMPEFIKMKGEEENGKTRGQMFVLDQNGGTGIKGITACFYDGSAIHLTDNDLQIAEITTRDIDRSHYPHYFLKEISESAMSIKRTLRGKYRIVTSNQSSQQVLFNIGLDVVPVSVRDGLQNGSIKNIIVIGHGTAAVAGQAVSDALSQYIKDAGINIMASIASELSGFGLRNDLSDTLVIPITQSGTTTDTNRAVAMAKERGAHIISVVNRRQSDITAKSHGVFYTSDGRDIEMSVASTKAFYAQIIAGQLLALYFAKLLGTRTDNEIATALRNLELAPCSMDRIFANRDAIAASVKKTVNNRYWAIVGSGPNKAAADEIRIKLSELCYKTISSDIVENKKHIDLSAEPLILVCASGNPQPVMEDVIKDVAIFKAHKATVVVFADEADHSFDQIADSVIGIPVAPSTLSVILNTMAGHLWGYYAARTIDEESKILREFRGHLSTKLTQNTQNNLSVFDMIADVSLRRLINEFSLMFSAHRLQGAFSTLGAQTYTNLSLLLKYATGKLPLQDIRHEFKVEEDLVNPFDLLDATLSKAIDELARPIDAIRHQAKTVTVGTSRKEKELKGIIFDLLESVEFSAKNLTYREILTTNRIQPAIVEIRGYTVYDIIGLDEQGNPTDGSTIVIRSKGGIAEKMTSRADHPTALMGTKRMIVSSGHIYVGKGKSDGMPIVIIPLLGDNNIVSNLLLIHINYNEILPLREKINVLGYRYHDIRNLINEFNLPWSDEYLASFKLEDLFSEPVEVIVGKIKSQFSKQ